MSDDALRYYKSGKSFIYRFIHSFWLASLVNRVLVAFVPLLLVLIPGLRVVPAALKWRIRLRLYRWYRTLLLLEREATGPLTAEQQNDVAKRLDELERLVNRGKNLPRSLSNSITCANTSTSCGVIWSHQDNLKMLSTQYIRRNKGLIARLLTVFLCGDGSRSDNARLPTLPL
jgi:hypothetical protein